MIHIYADKHFGQYIKFFFHILYKSVMLPRDWQQKVTPNKTQNGCHTRDCNYPIYE